MGAGIDRLVRLDQLGCNPVFLMTRFAVDACDRATNFAQHGCIAYAGGYFSLDPWPVFDKHHRH
jgi:hypothetical protein